MDRIQTVLMFTYAGVWAIVVIVTAIRTGEVPPALWAGLGVGEGALMALFRGDAVLRRGTGTDTRKADADK